MENSAKRIRRFILSNPLMVVIVTTLLAMSVAFLAVVGERDESLKLAGGAAFALASLAFARLISNKTFSEPDIRYQMYLKMLRSKASSHVAECLVPRHPPADQEPGQVAATALKRLANSSEVLAERLFDRAGVFLLSGIIAALFGVGLFLALSWWRPIPINYETGSFIGVLVDLTPRVSVLFFVEFIAIFLLRQYRTAMDEFRHYEAIKRHREETQVMVGLLAGLSPADLAKQINIYSSAGKLLQGESTDLLESRKLGPDDAALIGALGTFISAVRGKS